MAPKEVDAFSHSTSLPALHSMPARSGSIPGGMRSLPPPSPTHPLPAHYCGKRVGVRGRRI